jgi:glucan 1,3-beta-glucosidase
LSWNSNDETDVIAYNIYRMSDNFSDFQLISEKVDSVVYVDAEGISYLSEEVVTGLVVAELPALIQAENWTAMSGLQVESTTDIGGGNNVGFTDPGDWPEYSPTP